ncbi:MAG: helix-turn-helix domain-containing protein [Acidimicrobiales bacterium]
MTSSPIVARWELSRRLGVRRKELGLGVPAITEALGFTRNYWSAVENDRTLIAEDKLQRLFDILEFEEADRSELLQLREDSRQHGWWDDYSGILNEGLKRFCGLEFGAAKIRAFESNRVPGLLQIPEYTRAVLEPDPAHSPLTLEDHLAMRRQRQQRLESDPPLEFIAVLSEAALRQQVAGPDVQRKQLDHILNLVRDERALVQVRVIPFSTNPGAIAASSTLVLFDYASSHLPPIAWQEAERMLDIIDHEDNRFRRLEHSWGQGFERSMNDEDSALMMMEMLRSLE